MPSNSLTHEANCVEEFSHGMTSPSERVDIETCTCGTWAITVDGEKRASGNSADRLNSALLEVADAVDGAASDELRQLAAFWSHDA